jgi:hypothetical protein
MDYHQYLQSPSWKSLAQAARYRAGNACEFCQGSPDHVHHVKYPANKNYAADCLENLIVCCASCHAKQHGIRGKTMYKFDRIELSDGSKIIMADIDGKPWLRFDDLVKQFDIPSIDWGFYEKRLHENKDWVKIENALSRKLEVFLSRSGVNKLGAKYGTNKKGDEILQKLVDLDENQRMVVTDFGEFNDDPLIQSMVAASQAMDVGSKNCLAIAQQRKDYRVMQSVQQEHGYKLIEHGNKFLEMQEDIDKAKKNMQEDMQKTIEETNTKIVDLLDQSLKFMTSGNYIEINGVEHGIKPHGIYPSQNITNTQVFGLLCSKIYKELNSGEALPPKVLDGGGMVRRWPLDILKTAFSIFVRDYPKQDKNYSIF